MSRSLRAPTGSEPVEVARGAPGSGAAISRWRAGRGAGRARPRRCSLAPFTSWRGARLVPAARSRAGRVPGLDVRRTGEGGRGCRPTAGLRHRGAALGPGVGVGEVRRLKLGKCCLCPRLGASVRLPRFASVGEYGFGNLIFSSFSSYKGKKPNPAGSEVFSDLSKGTCKCSGNMKPVTQP